MELSPAVTESLRTIRDLIEFLMSDENRDDTYIAEMAQQMVNDLINGTPNTIEYYIAHFTRYDPQEVQVKVAEFESQWR